MPKLAWSKWSGLLLALLILGGGYFLLRPWWRLPFDRVHPFQAVIESAGMAIGIPDLTHSDSEGGRPWDADRQAVQQLFSRTDLRLVASWQTWWLVPQRGAQETVFTFIGNLEGRLSSAWNTMEYGPAIEHEHGMIYSWPQDSSARIYFAKYQNLLILGRLPLQVETALTAIHSEQNWYTQEAVKTLMNNPLEPEGAVDWQFMLHNPGWHESWPELDEIKNIVPVKEQQVGWAYLGLHQQDTLAHWYGRWVSESAMKMGEESTQNLLFTAPLPETVGQAITQATPKATSAQWQRYIAPWVGPELIFGQLKGAGRKLGQQDFWVLPIQDQAVFEEQMAQFAQQEGITDRREYQAFTLQQTLSSELLQPLSDRRGLNPWWVKMEDFVIFSVSREVLERFVDFHILGGYLSQQTAFLELASQMSTAPPASRYSYDQWAFPLTPKENDQLFHDQAWLTRGHMLSRNASDAQGGDQIEAWIKPNPITSQTVSLAWSTNLEATLPLRLLPVLNKNQEVTGCVVQDAEGQVWRLSTDGHIAWTTAAPRLYSPVYELVFSENEVGIVAASADRLHCWNTTGGGLSKFPHLTTAPATAPTVVRFSEANEDWTLFQPTAAGNIIAVNQDGSFLAPWSPLDSSGILRYPLQHVQLPDRDLLVGIVDTGQWRIWNRRGEIRYTQPGLAAPLLGSPQGQQRSDEVTDSQNRWVVVDATGRAQILTYAGESFPLRLGRGPADRFLFHNAWGDERADFWVQRASLLHLFAYEDNELAERWQYRFAQPVDTLIAFGEQGALVVSNVPQQLYLINGEGQLMPGFPLAGEGTAIPLAEEGQDARIITSVDATVYAYRVSGR